MEMVMKKTIITLSFVLFIILAACNTDAPNTILEDGNGESEGPNATLEPLDLSINESAAGITGRVVSSISDEPLGNVEVWLAEVVWNQDRTAGNFIIDGSNSPATRTRDDGQFLFNDLEPKDYVIVVGDLYGQNVIMSNNDGSARIYPAELGKMTDAGSLRVDLAPLPTLPPFDPYPEPGEEPPVEDAPEAYP
jgi:hypothetical protein